MMMTMMMLLMMMLMHHQGGLQTYDAMQTWLHSEPPRTASHGPAGVEASDWVTGATQTRARWRRNAHAGQRIRTTSLRNKRLLSRTRAKLRSTTRCVRSSCNVHSQRCECLHVCVRAFVVLLEIVNVFRTMWAADISTAFLMSGASPRARNSSTFSRTCSCLASRARKSAHRSIQKTGGCGWQAHNTPQQVFRELLHHNNQLLLLCLCRVV